MKLKDLKEWGGRDLPGFGDEATWGGRTPHGSDDDEQQSLADYIKNEFVSTADAPDDAFFINVGWFHLDDTEKEIQENLKHSKVTVTNDTGHDFAKAFNHAIKPMWDFCCGDTDHFISHEGIRAMQALTQQMGNKFSVTDLKAGVSKWMSIANAGPNTLDDIAAHMAD